MKCNLSHIGGECKKENLGSKEYNICKRHYHMGIFIINTSAHLPDYATDQDYFNALYNDKYNPTDVITLYYLYKY